MDGLHAATVPVMVVAYLVGAVPFGLVLVWLKTRGDVRKGGSGNIGATNVTRVAGKKLGALTLVLDAAKGAVPVLVMEGLGGGTWEQALVGAAAFLGHCFPVYLKFAGGKGIATGFGVVATLNAGAAALAAVVFGGVFVMTRISAAGTLAGLLAVVLAAMGTHVDARMMGLLLAMSVVVVAKHRANIQRLLSGRENRF